MPIEFLAYKGNIMYQVADHASLMADGKPYTVTIKRFRKSRSTGPESQNNHIFGHATQIAEHVGETPREIIYQAIEDCMARGYRTKRNFLDRVVPVPIHEEDTNDASLVIERLHEMAAFLDIRLREE